MNKKLRALLCAIILLATIPFFVMVAIFFASSGRKGDLVNKNNLYFEVSVADGVIEDNVDYVPFTVPKDGIYQLNVDYLAYEPGFYSALIFKDANDKAVFYFGAFSITGFVNRVRLPEGRCTLEIHYISTEQEFRDICAKYPLVDKAELEDFITGLDFDGFEKNGTWSSHLDMNVYEMIMPAEYMTYVTVAFGFVILLLLLVLYAKDPAAEDDDEKTRISGIGIRYGIFLTCICLFQYLSSILLQIFVPAEVISGNVVTISLILTILTMDVVGVLTIFLTTKKMPATPPEKHPFGFGKYLLFLLMTGGLAGLGLIIGSFVHGAFANNQASSIETIMLNSGLALRVLTVGILAPILEELVFRKWLIDRLLKHGEFVSIVISGVVFGLYHGNFQQFFFTTFAGMLWAFIYVRTGNVKNTIAIHMTVNMGTSIITVLLAQKFMEYNPTNTSDPAFITQLLTESPSALTYILLFGLWIMLLVTVAISGFVLFLVFFLKKKFRLKRLENEPTKLGTLAMIFSNAYFWIYLLVGLGTFIVSYLPGFIS